MRKMISISGLFLGLLFLILISGCTTTQGMARNAGDKGTSREYAVDYKTAYDAAVNACAQLDFQIEESSFEGRYIVAQNDMSGNSWGERIGFYFTSTGPQATRVRILSRAKIRTNVFAPKWEEELHQAIQERLNQLQAAGKVSA